MYLDCGVKHWLVKSCRFDRLSVKRCYSAFIPNCTRFFSDKQGLDACQAALDHIVLRSFGCTFSLEGCHTLVALFAPHPIVESNRRGSLLFRQLCRPPKPWASSRLASLVLMHRRCPAC